MIAFHPELDRLKSLVLEKHVFPRMFLQAQIDKVSIFSKTDILKRERKIK